MRFNFAAFTLATASAVYAQDALIGHTIFEVSLALEIIDLTSDPPTGVVAFEANGQIGMSEVSVGRFSAGAIPDGKPSTVFNWIDGSDKLGDLFTGINEAKRFWFRRMKAEQQWDEPGLDFTARLFWRGPTIAWNPQFRFTPRIRVDIEAEFVKEPTAAEEDDYVASGKVKGIWWEGGPIAERLGEQQKWIKAPGYDIKVTRLQMGVRKAPAP